MVGAWAVKVVFCSFERKFDELKIAQLILKPLLIVLMIQPLDDNGNHGFETLIQTFHTATADIPSR